MNSASYSYDASERHLRLIFAPNLAAEPHGREHRTFSHYNPQPSYPSEPSHTTASVPSRFSYCLPPLRGFDISHLRHESASSQHVETSRRPRLRRLAPSISRHSLIRPADLGLPEIAVDPQLLPPIRPPQPLEPPPILPSLIENGERQRPAVRLPDVQPPFRFNPSRPLSHLACIHPSSGQPPRPPQNTSVSPTRRRQRQPPSFLRSHTLLERLMTRRSSNDASGSSHHDEDILEAPLHPSIKVSWHDLPEDDKYCTICYNEYESKSEGFCNEDIYEEAVKVFNCQHIFGHKCLQKWLKGKNTCPCCREGVFIY
ncbi:hypothetical protein V8C42DRAFT_338866 [Trichoderma barbatum]